jgi:hypothetical protein
VGCGRDGLAGGGGGGGGPDQSAPVCGWTGTGRGPFAPETGVAMGIDVVKGGRPAKPRWRPTSKVTTGPSGLPMLIRKPSWMSTAGMRRLWTYNPLRLPLSMAIQRP